MKNDCEWEESVYEDNLMYFKINLNIIKVMRGRLGGINLWV